MKIFLISLIFSQSVLALWNGSLAEKNQFPAAVFFDNCSGTKVGERFILTAAHCVYNRGKKFSDEYTKEGQLLKQYNSGVSFILHFGVSSLNSESFSYTIKNTHVHPSYSKLNETEYVDIALIELKEKIQTKIKTATFNFNSVRRGQEILFSGYGLTKPEKIETELLNGNMFVSEDTSIKEDLHYAIGQVDDFNSIHFMSHGSGNQLPQIGDLPLLGRGDSGGAVYAGDDGSNLVILGVNSEANIHSTTSFMARIDDQTSSRVDLWIKNILSH